jgi:hypothetical protein
MTENDIYADLANNLSVPESEHFLKILYAMFTPEEARVCRGLFKQATCKQAAERLNIDEKILQEKLDDFKRRRLLFWGKTEYVFKLGIHVFFAPIPHAKEEYIPPGFWEAWWEFHPEEIERFHKWFSLGIKGPDGTEVPGNRVIPYRLALKASPNVKPEDVRPTTTIAK